MKLKLSDAPFSPFFVGKTLATRYSVMAYMGRESKNKQTKDGLKHKVDMCKSITDSLCCTPEINTAL